jgi:hypothetical protein
MISNVQDHYEYVPAHKEETAVIKIIKGPAKGMVYRYNKVSFEEVGDEMECNFDHLIIEEPLAGRLSREETKTILGDILICILEETLMVGGGIGDGQNRNDNIKEPSSQ